MNAFHKLTTLVRWDLVREARRRETIVNMTLFAVLILFAGLGATPLAQHCDDACEAGEAHGDFCDRE